MDNLDDSETNAKISDSGYSNSCSNSQSRRSRSSKSTHSGSNSSGSSGYGGKQSSGSSNNHLGQPPDRKPKDKDGKKKKQVQTELAQIQAEVEFRLPEPALPSEVKKGVQDAAPPAPLHSQPEIGVQDMDTEEPKPSEDTVICHTSQAPMNIVASRPGSSDGFSCVISMHDGVVMYTTSSLTSTIGFPKDMWIGRSFIDFIHPLDHSTFASQITSGLAVPKKTNETQDSVRSPNNGMSTMFCRIRRYRGLGSSFGVKDRTVSFMPFMLRLTFKNINEEKGLLIYLVIQATPLCSAFKTAHEIVVKAVSFVMRHVSNGNLEYIDHEAVPFLGYFPQDVTGKDVLQLYHPEDLSYMRQIYETIVKEGAAPRSKPYRLMAQNGNYLKLETEWSSFINPWSRKLEFVIAKHHVLEGPANPDVFQSPATEKITEEEKNKAQGLRESIVRIMNKVLTKPAEFAKQQMTKRCQDLASFMESLMEDQPKVDEELRLEIQEPENSYYERDSEMLGGISPHHDHSEGKSSSATPLSYNQLNFNDNLQRYFDSHEQLSYQDFQNAAAGTVAAIKNQSSYSGGCMSPMAIHSGDSAELTSSGKSSGAMEICKHTREVTFRLTESLLNKHNSDMEKTLVKKHRDCHSANREERERTSNDTKLKKKEHLARCNASFLPSPMDSTCVDPQPHGLKRASKQVHMGSSSHKHHCPGQRLMHRRQPTPPQAPHCHPASVAAAHWQSNNVREMNPYMPNMGNMGMSPQVSFISPVAAVPGLIPMYYVPTTGPSMPTTSEMPNNDTNKNLRHPPPIQYMMYGEAAVIGSPFMVSPINAQVPFAMPQNMMNQYPNTPQSSLGLARSNYEEACEHGDPLPHTLSLPPANSWREERRHTDFPASSSRIKPSRGISGCIYSASDALNRSTEAVLEPSPMPRDCKMKGIRVENSEENIDQTDGESSYSSFYSSFFKTDSGSAEDSGDAKKILNKNQINPASTHSKSSFRGKVIRRKIEPPWMEQVCVTSDLIYKYQISPKNIDEVLSADREKMAQMDQPVLVNEQLGQLYIDLQSEGAPTRLSLEESGTSSSSSGEDSNPLVNGAPKRVRRKREYSRLVLIYEEDAPLPPPPENCEEPTPSPSLS